MSDEMSEAMKAVMIEQLAEAQMRGYREGLKKGILLAEHFTGHDLTAIRESIDEAINSGAGA